MDGCRGFPNLEQQSIWQNHWRTVCRILVKALRTLFSILTVGVLFAYLLNKASPSDLAADYAKLESELKELKARCLSDNCNGDVISQTCQQSNEDGDCKHVGGNEHEIRSTIRKQLELYAADKTGMADFAMHNLGGCVISVRDTRPFNEKTFLGINFGQGSDPHEMLRPEVEPGRCWSFQGNRGAAVIKLIAPVFLTHVTLEHISSLMSPSGEIASAPKKFALLGMNDPDAFIKQDFGRFEFKADGPPVQTFLLAEAQQSFRYVEIVFESNHGNPLYTCVYRVRIHGKLDSSAHQLA